ncbi:tRNA (guanosine(46)-N7)-methyltransferase TrmB [Sphingomonas rhizophila]|uniref:tRNA (guanine-N(7)-)-methyltransferase n=1 Tax=Sphingomonas rhizophila TaxID=2071607 RepID=A0A7G9SC58_9SPHN|nr:tRNA (guanine(46)-N(7))-methyltransferase TrmB [Sphingomonas rhizophila]QNN65433.1 tRNA (guanosine(46)-N7)-methyltransferase TrmB [Sphingomonas rhizophila]
MTAFKSGDPTTLNRLYGRSSGHKLRQGQAELVETLLPAISVPADGEVTAVGLFGEDRPLHFEIGFGGGEHLAYRADMLPDHGFIGCEPFLNGVAQALGHIRDQRLTNVRLWMGDALDVLRRIPDGALSFVYLLHPDPWPKARHAKRRMANDGPIELIASKMKPGGEFRIATDHPVYLAHTLMVMQRHTEAFDWLAETPKDFLQRPGGWPATRYEQKAKREGRDAYALRYRRR